MDEFRLRMDFMPYVERSVKPYGLVVDQVTYYADVLRPWINVVDPKHKGHKFIVRRDPRDISIVYFASSGEFVGDDRLQPAFSVRNRRNFRQVESNDLC